MRTAQEAHTTKSRIIESLFPAKCLHQNQSSDTIIQESENNNNTRTSHPALLNVTDTLYKQQPKLNAFKKQIGNRKAGTVKYTAAAEITRGKASTAARPAIDTRLYATVRIKDKKDSSATETKNIPQSSPLIHKNARIATRLLHLRSNKTNGNLKCCIVVPP